MSFLTAVPIWVWFVALIVISIVLIRLQNHRLRSPRRIKAAVEGIAHVVSVSEYGRRSGISQGFCTMTLVLEAPGMAATTVSFKQAIAPKVWPTPGMTLPIYVDPKHPTRYSIRWGEQSSPATAAASQAADLQALLREHGTFDQQTRRDTLTSDWRGHGQTTTVNLSEMDAATRARVQSMLDTAHDLLANTELNGGLDSQSGGTSPDGVQRD